MERKNIYIVILTITTIIVACFAVYFAVNPIAKNEEINNVENNNELNSSTNEVQNNEEKDTDSSNVEIVEKIVYEYKRPTIDVTKCINPREGTGYSMSRDTRAITNVCSASTVGENGVSLIINWYSVEQQYNITKPSSVNDGMPTETKTISNFNSNVVDVYIGNIGQGVKEVLIFLMEDGTVEYMPLYEALQSKEYKSYGKITGVENVVEIVNGGTRNGATICGLKQDGSFYDLGKIIIGM